jgi:hypothetical protein
MKRMKRLTAGLCTGICLLLASATFVVLSAGPSRASWVSDHCKDNDYVIDRLKRSEARAYAGPANREGYQWGGGCWIDDNVDPTPNDPPAQYTYGEGPDCSGLAFKTWALRLTEGAEGFRHYDYLEYVHGPYSTADLHAPVKDDPFFLLPDKARTTTVYMDLFARNDGTSGHVGLLWTDAYPSANTDYIIEAKGESYGTHIYEEGFRYDSRYVAVRRGAWTPDCYPSCSGPGSTSSPYVLEVR